MNSATARRAVLLLAGSMLFAGCVAFQAATRSGGTPRPAAAISPGTMSPGMVMPDGTVMGADTPPAAPAPPSAAAEVICSAEARDDIAKALARPTAPPAAATWSDHLYTCTYQLPYGQLVASVKENPDAASTAAYYDQQRRRLRDTTPLAGLTPTAAGTPDGTVVLVKDDNVLTVDATRLPAEFGPQHQKRTDFAYEVAAIILGCWTGDDD